MYPTRRVASAHHDYDRTSVIEAVETMEYVEVDLYGGGEGGRELQRAEAKR